MRRTALFCLQLFAATLCMAQTEVTTQEAKQLYKNTTKRRVSVHDPSVVYDPSAGRYYVFGSHKAGAWSTDLQNWTPSNPTWQVGNNTNASNREAFVTPAVKKVKKGGTEVDFPQFNAMEWSARTDAAYNIDGNMWAPDVVWNPTMEKWCMYLSINGDAWYSSIILLTADKITGPYEYQGPVVVCGFRDATHSYKDTDLELVIGQQSTLPVRYARTSTAGGQTWGDRWPHTIDPAAFFDADGRLWLVYGSWSGGIWMLELDETTGLRDYDVAYPSTDGDKNTVTSDPYFGTKIAGGLYVSGEGPYIERIGQYYYLFVSYGGFAPDGGYEMRVFRSQRPDGPYVDAAGRPAIFTSWVQNYGTGADTRGQKLMGSYNQWGLQTVGECAQGHNSVVTTPDGLTFLVYHTKFNDGTTGHQVRVHQLFQNADGWLVASPFEYNGETVTDATLQTAAPLTTEQIAGTYQLLLHKYKMDYANHEEVTPVEVTLTEDGRVGGAYSGTWAMAGGTSQLTLTLAGTVYKGVAYEEQMDGRSLHTVSLTAISRGGASVWAYKLHPRYAVAWQVNNQTVPLSAGMSVARSYDLYGAMQRFDDNVQLQWSSSAPAVINDYGRYNPVGLTDDSDVTLTLSVASADYFWQHDYKVKAQSEANATATADWDGALVAHYGFDDEALSNSLNPADRAELKTSGLADYTPTLADDEPLRCGRVVSLRQGGNPVAGMQGYVSMPNPLYGLDLQDGCTISFFVRRADDNLWDALMGFQQADARFYVTGNLYAGFNDGQGNWLDQNYPTQVQPAELSAGRWHLLTIVCERSATAASGGITLYVDGMMRRGDVFNGALATGQTVATKQAFDYDLLLDHIAACTQFCLGNGSFWSAPAAMFDDVMVHSRALSLVEVMALRQMTDRVHLLGQTLGIADAQHAPAAAAGVYDLQGRRVEQPRRGIYISNGKKHIIR